ncbi:hypothetical protein V3C99_006701, partial [Haemonchus contortus]|uniref:APCDDC domain-containing protein n=1 Tax=Haemonchus contortus TaxID=6289 RepID=A0A7I4YR16_HAECO
IRSLSRRPSTYKLVLLATRERTTTTTFPTASDNCEGQMMFLKLHLMLWLLVAFAVPVESIKLRWYYHGDNSKCATAGMTDKSTLRMSRVYTVVFDKKTKLILFIKKFHFGESGGVGGYVNVEYTGNVTQNLGFGMYMSLLRTSRLRRNENLITNYLHNYEKFDKEGTPVPPGTGIDFSEMYNEAPFLFRTHILEVTETGVEKNIRLYVSDKCGVDQTWIANEGYYRLDTDTGQYLPTYYDPMQSDFYY